MKRIGTDNVIQASTPAIEEAGMVGIGYLSPAFPPVRTTPTRIADNGTIQMGFTTPMFPPVRSR